MHRATFVPARICLLAIMASVPLVDPSSTAAVWQVDVFRLRTPGDTESIDQASDLCYGRVGERDGLWIVCDRNGGAAAGRIYYVSARTVGRAVPGKAIVADEAFTVAAPADWAGLAARYAEAGDEVLADVRRRVIAEADRENEPYLDLEGIAIAPAVAPPHDPRLFVVSEEPYSAILELSLEGRGADAKARLFGVYHYKEDPKEQGTARNDGLEGIAWAGEPGLFYLAEEGTKDTAGRENALLLFMDPRLVLARLDGKRLVVQTQPSDALTSALRAQRKGAAQTLNALTTLRDGKVLGVDRNGGSILRIDPKGQTAERWLNLYMPDGLNLREVLKDFPQDRHMPYVSIEGIAVDPAGDIWLCDDPAIPEGWRESCLVRVREQAHTRPDS